jgi:predicted metal-dependent peptidase
MRYGRSELSRRAGVQEFSYAKPSRRQAGLGRRIILPGMTGREARVAVLLDVSGSMQGQAAAESLREIDGLFVASGARVTFYAADVEVRVAKRISSWKDAASCFTRGGTDFAAAIEAVARERPLPDLAVYLTDGWGQAPAAPPPYPIVWLIVGHGSATPTSADGGPVRYGKILRTHPAERANESED